MAEGVEDEREVLQYRCLDVLHQFRPVTIEGERTGGDEDREQHHDGWQHRGFDERASGVSEELLAALRRRSLQPDADQDAFATCSAGTKRA